MNRRQIDPQILEAISMLMHEYTNDSNQLSQMWEDINNYRDDNNKPYSRHA